MTSDRFVITARIIGAVHKQTPKLKTFMISVLWSDDTEVIVYRSFPDFQTLHRDLKKKFPTLNPFKKNKRVIPKFRGKARKSSLPQKGSRRSMLRMKFLETYCDQLLQCEHTVVHSSEVLQFFLPREHDLQQDFTSNSVMILMGDDVSGDASGAGGAPLSARDFTRQQGGSITQPFVTQTYRCVAAYETKDTKNRAFNVDVDEKLDVLIKDPAGWWLVESEDKRLAWFPAPYLELLDGEDDDDDDVAGFHLGGNLYCAVRSFSTKKEDEVSVPMGSVVEVLRKSHNGWWFVRLNGKAGYVPSMYLKPYNNPRAGIFSLQRKMHGSTLTLATPRDPQPFHPPGISEETGPRSDLPNRIHKAQSLDVLSESWIQNQAETDSRKSSVSGESSLSGFSSDSGSNGSLSRTPDGEASPRGDSASPDLSLSDAESLRSRSSDGAPSVPPRPRTEEILNRCTTMTRKAALATKTRLRSRGFESAMSHDERRDQSVRL